MNTKDTATRWNCSPKWVRERCNEGLIPLAHKRVRWDIPKQAEKPPCTGIVAALIIENLLEIEQGHDIIIIPPRIKNGKEIVEYLSAWGFLSEIPPEGLNNRTLHSIRTLERGKELITKVRKKNNAEKTVKTTVEGGVEIGIAHAKVNHTVEEKSVNAS